MEDSNPRGVAALRHSIEDPAAFSDFYSEYAETILIFFTRRTFGTEVALDLTAETFAQAFAARRGFKGATDEEAGAWLYGIARHQLAHYFRRGEAERRALSQLGVTVPALGEEEHARIEELAGLADLRALVAEELRKLSREHQEALRMRIVEELSYPDIARRLEISEQMARARVSRGLRVLARSLDRAPVARRGTS